MSNIDLFQLAGEIAWGFHDEGFLDCKDMNRFVKHVAKAATILDMAELDARNLHDDTKENS